MQIVVSLLSQDPSKQLQAVNQYLHPGEPDCAWQQQWTQTQYNVTLGDVGASRLGLSDAYLSTPTGWPLQCPLE